MQRSATGSRFMTYALMLLAGCAAGLARSSDAPASQGVVPSGPGSLAGLWIIAEYKGSGGSPERERLLHTVDGSLPPMLPWAAALVEKRIHDSEAGAPFANTLTQCLPGGIPEMLFGAPYPVQILETAGQVTMLFDEQNHFRLIPLNTVHDKDADPSYMGDAIGHWEGDTLVVDTIGLTERTTLDQIGMPHTSALHVVERYRRSGKDTLEIKIHIEDPGAFSKPWDTRISYRVPRAGTKMDEYICENNRNLPDAQGNTGFQH